MWSWVRQCRNRCAETNERALVRECESFLSGRYATFLESRGLPVPDWAWLSELAHAPAEQVTALVAAPRRRARVLPPARWQKAMSLLAQELVATAQRTDCTVDELRDRCCSRWSSNSSTRQSVRGHWSRGHCSTTSGARSSSTGGLPTSSEGCRTEHLRVHLRATTGGDRRSAIGR